MLFERFHTTTKKYVRGKRKGVRHKKTRSVKKGENVKVNIM